MLRELSGSDQKHHILVPPSVEDSDGAIPISTSAVAPETLKEPEDHKPDDKDTRRSVEDRKYAGPDFLPIRRIIQG